jgi:hypothetical protein
MTLIADKQREITSGGLGNRPQVPSRTHTRLLEVHPSSNFSAKIPTTFVVC